MRFLLAIAQGHTSQAEITATLGGMAIGGHPERLEHTYSIISKYRPIHSKPGSKNTVRFRISDNSPEYFRSVLLSYIVPI